MEAVDLHSISLQLNINKSINGIIHYFNSPNIYIVILYT